MKREHGAFFLSPETKARMPWLPPQLYAKSRRSLHATGQTHRLGRPSERRWLASQETCRHCVTYLWTGFFEGAACRLGDASCVAMRRAVEGWRSACPPPCPNLKPLALPASIPFGSLFRSCA